MDWFSWLSKTPLDPPFIHEYAIVFSHNQLQQEDISYFNHEFLQSMGIAIAKHRLEILKLAKKASISVSNSNSNSNHHPLAKLIAAIKATNRSFASCVGAWVHRHCRRRDSAALVAAQKRRSYSSRWKGAMLKRGNRLVMTSSSTAAVVRDGGGSAAKLLLTDGNRRRPVVVGSGGGGGGKMNNGFSSPMVYGVYEYDHGEDKADDGGEIDCFSDGEDGGGAGGGGYWSGAGGEEIKWDAMFQNLKPT